MPPRGGSWPSCGGNSAMKTWSSSGSRRPPPARLRPCSRAATRRRRIDRPRPQARPIRRRSELSGGRARLRNLLCLPCRHPLSTVVVLAVLGLLAFFGGRHLWADHHLRLAQRALDTLDLSGAEAHLRQCLRVRPMNGQVHVLLAQVARRTQNYEEADHELEICEQLGVRTEQAELERLLLRVQRGDLGGADYDLYQRSEPDSPESMLILEALAQGYLSTFHIHGAMRCLERMLERQPDNTRALFLKGQVMENTNRFGEA